MLATNLPNAPFNIDQYIPNNMMTPDVLHRGVGLGLKIGNQTLPFDKLELTEKERDQLVDFIKTLDSR